MRITLDEEGDAAYVYVADPIRAGESARQIAVEGTTVILDFDHEGRLLGIEILGASRHLREDTLARARGA
jgi:uncharacterized protein YuzE